MASRVWFITGASRGLGLAIAQAALENGDSVVATARNAKRAEATLTSPDRVLAVSLDVTDAVSVRNAAAAALSRFGRIDVVVNNAGYGLMGAIEAVDAQEIEQVFKTNFFGAHEVLRALLPTLRAQRSGCIVNISSVGGFTGTPGAGAYNASKFALEGMSEALAQELAPLGIRVIIVEPGYFRTDFLDDSLRTAKATIADYSESAERSIRSMTTRNGKQPGDPHKAARVILQAVDSPRPPLRLALGADSVERITNKLAAVRRDLEDWRALSVSTNFDADAR
jgi:NAD(P)-dependent dehydrogenase (short-subunit alcohol dehydrogenase family)